MGFLLDNRTGKKCEPKTYFSIDRKDNLLLAHFKAYDSSLNSYSSKHNDDLYKGDVVEIFLTVGVKDYIEIEVAPNGATFVASILNRRITFIDDSFLKTNVEINSNDYFVDIIIDLSNFKNIEEIRYNAFRIETKGIKVEYILQAANPTLSNTFHVKDKFITL